MADLKLLLVGAISNSEAIYSGGIKKRFGGSVMYAARTARGLGIDTTVITIGAEDIDGGINELEALGITVHKIKRATSNNSSNDYTSEPRKMYLRSFIDKPISQHEIKLDINPYRFLVLLPIFGEVSHKILPGFSGKPVFLDLQGLVRKNDAKNSDNLYPVAQSDWEDMENFIGKIEILKASSEDLAKIKFPEGILTDEDKCKYFVNRGFPIFVLTRGDRNTLVCGNNLEPTEVPVKKVANLSSAGAGDIFNIAFIYKYLETKDIVSSAQFANDYVGQELSGS